MEKIATQIITVFDDGTISVQELHPATTSSLTEDEPPPSDPPGDGIETPPKGPGNP